MFFTVLHSLVLIDFPLITQKIVKNGFTCGVVTYSNADDAAGAMMTLSDTKGFLVSLWPREVREAHQNERPKRLIDLQDGDGFSDMPPQRLPRLQDSLCPPVDSQVIVYVLLDFFLLYGGF